MKKYFPYLILILFILIGIVVRFYKLGSAPAGLYLDEAGQGYSAYSILKTGKDEFGMPFPVAFRSFNDFKTPVYIYLIVPLIPVFGLNAFTIRLPSFIFSILTLPLLYFLIIRLMGKSKQSVSIALLSVLFLAISPWHTLFGRTNFECNVALFFLLFGYFLFYKGLQKPVWFIFSALIFAIALPAYHSERILVPLIIIFLFSNYRKILFSKNNLRYTLIAIFLGGLLVYPTFRILTTPGFMARVSALNIFSKGGWTYPLKQFFSLYFYYLSPKSLFFLGDSGPRSSFPEISVFYFWQLPLYLYGLWLLFKVKYLGDLKKFLILFLIISPIPAAMTSDPFSSIRSLPLVIPITILMAVATDNIYVHLKSLWSRRLSLALFIMIIFWSVAKLFSSAIILNEYQRAQYWDYGWQQIAETIKTLDPNLPIVVDNARTGSYIFLAVFLKTDPTEYQKNNFEVTPENYYTDMKKNDVKVIGRIITRPIDWKPDTHKQQYLIGDSLAISYEQIEKNHLLLIREVFFPDGSPAFRIVKTNPNLTK